MSKMLEWNEVDGVGNGVKKSKSVITAYRLEWAD